MAYSPNQETVNQVKADREIEDSNYVPAEEVVRYNSSDIKKMREVSNKTGYEASQTVCTIEDGKLESNIVLGGQAEAPIPDCGFGDLPEVRYNIHTHNRSPPSPTDLRKSVDKGTGKQMGVGKNFPELCVLVSDMEQKENDIVDGNGMLVCFQATEEVDKQTVEQVHRIPEGRTDHIKKQDIKDLEEAGFNVSTANLKG